MGYIPKDFGSFSFSFAELVETKSTAAAPVEGDSLNPRSTALKPEPFVVRSIDNDPLNARLLSPPSDLSFHCRKFWSRTGYPSLLHPPCPHHNGPRPSHFFPLHPPFSCCYDLPFSSLLGFCLPAVHHFSFAPPLFVPSIHTILSSFSFPPSSFRLWPDAVEIPKDFRSQPPRSRDATHTSTIRCIPATSSTSLIVEVAEGWKKKGLWRCVHRSVSQSMAKFQGTPKALSHLLPSLPCTRRQPLVVCRVDQVPHLVFHLVVLSVGHLESLNSSSLHICRIPSVWGRDL